MRRTITSHNGDGVPGLSKFIPSVVARHPKYDYVLGTELKHGTNSLERGLDIKYNSGYSNNDKLKVVFDNKDRDYSHNEDFPYEEYKEINWVTIWRSTDSILTSLYQHYWREWFGGATGFAEFQQFLDWCFGIKKYNCDFYPNEDHSTLKYRIWQAYMKNYYNMTLIDISETNDLIEFWGGEPKHLNKANRHNEKKYNANIIVEPEGSERSIAGVWKRESFYDDFVERLDHYKSDWYRVQLMCDKVNVTKFEDFRKSATLGRNDVDSTSENSTKGLQESPQ